MKNLRSASMMAVVVAVLWAVPQFSHAIFGFGGKDAAQKQGQTQAQGDRSSASGTTGVAGSQSAGTAGGNQAAGSGTPGTQASGAPSSGNQNPAGQTSNAQMPGVTNGASNTVKFQVPNPPDAASAVPAGNGSASNPAANAAANAAPAAPPPTGLPGSGTNLPTEVVIKGSETGAGAKIHGAKPALSIDTDPFESIRASLEPDESLLLAESPFTVSWRRTYPEFLHNERVVQPWRTTFSDRPGIVFAIRDQLNEAMQRPVDDKEARGFQWSLTIADEEGRVFQHYEGSKDVPQELVWNGQNDQGEWIKAGRSYSAIYMFTDPAGSPHTKVGKPILFTGIMHQESDGLHVSLDSSVLFGQSKDLKAIQKNGEGLLRASADLIKRRYSGIPMRSVAYASTKELADAQATAVQNYLLAELMVMPAQITTDSEHAQFSEQRVEIILLNR